MFTKIEQKLGRKIPGALEKLSGGKWEPEVGESYLIPELNRIRVIGEIKGEFLYYIYRYDAGKMDIGNSLVSTVIPLLEWQKIKEALEGMGYIVSIGRNLEQEIVKGRFQCDIEKGFDFPVISECGETHQEAFQRAILALVEKKGR